MMLNLHTKEPLKIVEQPYDWAHIRLPLDQVPEVRKLFDEHQVNYWLETFAYANGNEPFIARISFSRKENVARVQQLLDAA